MDFGILFKKFQEHNIRYVVCGGLAVNLHGIPRMTADIDIILDLTEPNLLSFEKCTSDLNYNLSVPVKLTELSDELSRRKLIQSKNLVALSFYNFDKNFLALDLLIDFPIPFEELWNSRAIRKEGDLEVCLVSIDHLIKLKEYSNRAQDKQDIYYLSKIKNGTRT